MIPLEGRELSGALLLGAGLVLGGALLSASRYLGVELPGLRGGRPPAVELRAEAGSDSMRAADSSDRGAGSGGDARGGGRSESPVPGAASGRSIRERGARLAPIDINSASLAELQKIVGVGPAIARRIIALREEKGGRFGAMEDLLEVRGIGPATLERIRAGAELGRRGEER